MCTMKIMHTMASEALVPIPKRRAYNPELKGQVVAQTRLPGASVAGVALAHGINANIVHRWLREHAGQPQAGHAGFVALSLTAWADGRHWRATSTTGHCPRQQLGREPDPPNCDWALELAVCRITACGQTRRSGDEPGAFGAPERARSLRIPEGHPRAAAHAVGQSHPRAAAASLAGPTRHYLMLAAIVNTGSPRAYRPGANAHQRWRQGCRHFRRENAYCRTFCVGVPVDRARISPSRMTRRSQCTVARV